MKDFMKSILETLKDPYYGPVLAFFILVMIMLFLLGGLIMQDMKDLILVGWL